MLLKIKIGFDLAYKIIVPKININNVEVYINSVKNKKLLDNISQNTPYNTLLMSKNISYPINKENMNKWINKQCDKCSKDFAQIVANHTQHITFTEFNSQLIKISNEIKNISGYEKIILIVPEIINKSNFWATLLIWEYIKEKITNVVCNVSDAYTISKLVYYSKIKNKKILFILVDDGIYSGKQMKKNIHINISGEFDKQSTHKFIDCLIACPYISSNGKKLLLSNKKFKIIFPQSSKIMQPLIKYLKDLNCIFNKKYYLVFQYNKNLVPYYFDHKLADSISILQKIYALGSYYNCEKPQTGNFSLITGCENFYNNIINNTNINIDKYIIDLKELDLKYKNNLPYKKSTICPPAFYKKINYKYKNAMGKIVSLNKNNSLCYLYH